MYPWDVLCIDETDDKKVIKKAYAKLIKKYRPDEAPEKFQEINRAYQCALNIVDLPTENVGFETVSDIHNEEVNKQNEVNDNLERVNTCIKKVNFILEGNIQTINNLTNWEVVDNLFLKMTFEEKSHVAYVSFQKCYDINNSHIKKSGVIKITERTLQYLDSLFNWSEHWQEYQHCFTKDCNRLNFNIIEGNNEYSIGSFSIEPWKRMLALLIDITLVLSICFLRVWLTTADDVLGFFLYSFIFYQIIIEVLLKQETLGCKLLKYKANSHFYTSVTHKQSVIRLVAFHLMFAPIYMVLLGKDALVMKALVVSIILYVVWIIVFFGGKKYMHDELASITMVKT